MMSPHPLVPSLLTILLSITTIASATTIDVVNNCDQTVWAASFPAAPEGGKQLNKGDTWTVQPAAGVAGARIWGRTNCNFNTNGQGHCETADCGGALDCTVTGANPQTIAEYTLAPQPNNPSTDTFDISLVNGFNLPMGFGPATGGDGGKCRPIQCSGNVIGDCPATLQTTGGCFSGCDKLNTDQLCCRGAYSSPQTCQPSQYSQYFKGKCPDAYSYAHDDQSSTFTCPSGTNYKVTFCP